MKDKTALARGWVRKGDSDLADARRTVESEGPYDTACFHAQQAVEKYLKGLLAFHGKLIPRIHDLEELARLCALEEDIPALIETPLEELSGYAVEMRYDADFWPERETAAQALSMAERLRALIIENLPDGVADDAKFSG